MNTKRKKSGRKLLSFLLTLAMLVGMMPGMALTAYADTEKSETIATTRNTVAGTHFTISNNGDYVDCDGMGAIEGITVSPKNTEYITKVVITCGYGSVSDNKTSVSSGEKAIEGSTITVTNVNANTFTFTCKIDSQFNQFVVYYLDSSPAAAYSVTVTPGSNMTKTTDSGEAQQTGLSGEMTPVVYTASEDYYFPTDYNVAAVNGISVTRNSYTQITVSGTPTADTEITLTAPTAKTTPDAPATASATGCTTADNNDGKLTGVTTAMEYKKSDADSWTAGTGNDITGLVPGTYYVRVKATDTTNASANQTLTIAAYQKEAAVVTKTPTEKTLTYNGQAQELVTAGTATGGEMQYALGTKDAATQPYTTSIPTGTDAGTYYVWYKAKGDSSHADSDAGYVIAEIKKSEGGGTPGEKTLVYNGTAQELVTAGKAEGGTMQYALGENADTAPEASAFTASIPTGMDAKTYYVWYMVKGDENHNDTKPACVEATIAKKGLTVTAEAKSKTQGEADPALTYTASGLVGSDTLTGALSREAGEDPGTYAITQGTLTAGDNYEITFTSAVLTINKKDEPAPVPSGGGGVYYGGGTVSSQPQAPYSQVIGATATSYGDSSPERIHNIELACEKLDGIVLQPGEVFSFNEALGGLTAEAGFAVAPVYPGDEATAVMGGGVSQVASTLYASSLFALLETVERSNHEYAVPFAQAGVDADVSNPAEGGGLDLKFRNSRSEPIKIVVTSKVDEAKQIREITVELRSVLAGSDYMPVRFDNSKSGEKDGVLFADVLDPTRPGYRIVLDHEEQSFTDANGSGIRTLTHRKILDAGGWLVKDEILNARLPDGSYAMDTYYTKG